MKPLEDDLRKLFRRREPPQGFAERVVARLETKQTQSVSTQRVSALFWRPVLRWVAVVAVCAVAILGVVRYKHEQRRRAEAERATQEAIFALRITNKELNTALQRAQQATVQALSGPKNTKSAME
jgi:hypothetical protein